MGIDAMFLAIIVQGLFGQGHSIAPGFGVRVVGVGIDAEEVSAGRQYIGIQYRITTW